MPKLDNETVETIGKSVWGSIVVGIALGTAFSQSALGNPDEQADQEFLQGNQIEQSVEASKEIQGVSKPGENF